MCGICSRASLTFSLPSFFECRKPTSFISTSYELQATNVKILHERSECENFNDDA